MHTAELHRAYGLVVRSELPLPELERVHGGPVDVEIVQRPVARRQKDPGEPLFLELDGDDAYFEYGYIGRFQLRGCSLIEVDPNPGIPPGLPNLAVLGAVMALVLERRGMLTLHAGAVEGPDGAWVFMGDKGAGKSTLTGALVAGGFKLLADDICAIGFENGKPTTLTPAYPQLKLSDEAVARFPIGDAVRNPAPIPEMDKQRLCLGASYQSRPTPIGGLFVISRGETPALTRLDPAEALGAVLRYSYAVRFGGSVLNGAAAGRHMRRCASVADRIPVWKLTTPTGIGALGQVGDILRRLAPCR